MKTNYKTNPKNILGFLMAFAMVFFSTNVSASSIGTCGDFVSGPSAWPHVLVATTVADGAVSQGAQTFTMNVTSLPASGANFRVYKTTANGNAFFGNAVALTLGTNTVTVGAVGFDRAVKFQFSDGSVEFDVLSVNGVASGCVCVATSSSTTVSACDSYGWNGNTYTLSGTYTWTDTNSIGCDSTVILDLTINNSSSSSTTVTACDSYTWNGNTYTSSGTYIWTGTNAAGCDSTANLDITITTVNVAVNVVDDSTLQAQAVATGTLYQWVDCNDNFAPIAGETNAIFATQNSGYYAVEVSLNDCSVISDCFTISITTGIDALYKQYGIQLFPNPTKNGLTISLKGIDVVDIVITDIQGKVLLQQSGLFDQDRINVSGYFAGTYFVKIMSPEVSREIRVIKH